MNEENFIQNLTRLFSPSFWAAFDSFFNIFEEESRWKKSNSDLWLEVYEMRTGDGAMDIDQQYTRIRIRQLKSHIINAGISFYSPLIQQINSASSWVLMVNPVLF